MDLIFFFLLRLMVVVVVSNRVAKVIGDKRAVVAERGFNRPYTKVQVTNCGFIESQDSQ